MASSKRLIRSGDQGYDFMSRSSLVHPWFSERQQNTGPRRDCLLGLKNPGGGYEKEQGDGVYGPEDDRLRKHTQTEASECVQRGAP